MLPQPAVGSVADIEPGRIKVFGVIHIVFGSLGLMNVVGMIGMEIFREPFIRLTGRGSSEEWIAVQVQMYRDLSPSTWISIVISLIVSALILQAGIALVRRRQSSVGASNTYALASLIAKGASVLLFYVMVMPVMSRHLEPLLNESIPGSDPADLAPVLAGIKIAMVVAGVLAPLLGAIYPLCTLVMLNKPQVKEFLAKNGT